MCFGKDPAPLREQAADTEIETEIEASHGVRVELGRGRKRDRSAASVEFRATDKPEGSRRACDHRGHARLVESLPRCLPRQIEREDASPAWEIAHAKLPAIRFRRLARDVEPEPRTGSIMAALREWYEQLVDLARREPAAFVL